MIVDNFKFRVEEEIKTAILKNLLKTQDYPLKIGLQD